MWWLLLPMLATAADPLPVVPGPSSHTWSTHFRLWSRVGDGVRDLSIGHDLVLSKRSVDTLVSHRGATMWRPMPGDERDFGLDDMELTVSGDGSWSTTKGTAGDNAAWVASNDRQLLVLDGTTLHVFLKQAVGVTATSQGFITTYDVDYDITEGSFDFAGLLQDPSRWTFVSYADDLGTEERAHKWVVLPSNGDDLDPTRSGYSFFFYAPKRGQVDALAARVRITGEPPPRANARSGGTVFTVLPPVSAPRWSPWSVELWADGAAQVGGLIELDRPRPDFIGGATVRVQLDKYVYDASVYSAGLDGLIGWRPHRRWFLGARGGLFTDAPHGTAVIGTMQELGGRERWRLSADLGIGSALIARGRLTRVIRTGRRWDLAIGATGSAIDVDWIVDKNPRFPIYGGLTVGAVRSGWQF